MNEPNRAGTHPSEGDLVRYLDHQVTADERRGMLAHLSECDACARTVATLGEQSRFVAGYLADFEADAAPDELTRARALAAARGASRGRFVASRGLRAAAVAAVVIATVGVSPLRAWVVDRIQGILDDDAPRPAVVLQPAAAVQVGSEIAFEPTGDVFNLELDAEQATGEVRLTLGSGSRVAAQVIGGAESFTVLPAGVLVENEPASTSSYEIAVPGSVRLVQLFAGGRLVGTVEVDPSAAGWSHTFELDQR